MPDLHFQILGVEAVSSSLTPLLQFRLAIAASGEQETIQGLMLNAQIQIQCPQRPYSDAEKERLVELFGPPDRWRQTLRNRLWTHAQITVGAFSGSAETMLPVPCTYDLNIASTKYFYALDAGEVSLLFLFSGSIFYATPDGRLQVERISWDKECQYRIPVQTWRDLMEREFPNRPWLTLQRDIFDRLYFYRRQNGFASWEQTIESLLREPETTGDSPSETLNSPVANAHSTEVPA